MGQEFHTIPTFDKLRFKTGKKPITSENKALVRQTIFLTRKKYNFVLCSMFFFSYTVIMLELRVKVNGALLEDIRNKRNMACLLYYKCKCYEI